MSPHKLLLVDDEQGILDSLTRLFFEEDYETETASSGNEALKKLSGNNFSLIISDQRMPEMTGAQFLQKAKELHPDTIRIMLTGYSDIKDAVAAINKGEVHKYINKPWDDDELKMVVKQALKQYDLIAENRELHAIVKEQNEALKDINKNLEQKVQERTHQIEEINKELERNFITSIRVFTGMISQYDEFLGEHSKRVSILARKLAESMKLPDTQLLDIEIAGLLHDIGAISLHKRVFSKDTSELSNTELLQLQRHPVLGQDSLKAIEKLKGVGLIIRHHHEHYDGTGYPDGLERGDIPVEARIIAVVDRYDLRANARSYFQEASPQLAAKELMQNRGTRFDPEIVNAFFDLLKGFKDSLADEIALHFSKLEKGMKLSRDLLTKSGVLIINKCSVIKEKDLERIHNFHATDPIIDKVYVYKSKTNNSSS